MVSDDEILRHAQGIVSDNSESEEEETAAESKITYAIARRGTTQRDYWNTWKVNKILRCVI